MNSAMGTRNRTGPPHSCRGIIAAATLFVTVVAAVIVYGQLPDYRNAIHEQRRTAGTSVVDRNGRLLRVFPDHEGCCNLWRGIETFPDVLKNAVIAAEDKRFQYHPGFDPIAIVRAVYTNITQGRTVSGASTITQQVVRLIEPRPRTYSAKIVELLSSMKMEWQLSKDEILELYLNLSPMGGTIRGASLATRIYLGKDVAQIGAAEAAVIAALPRSPSHYSPRHARGRKLLFREKDRILKRMAGLGFLPTSRLNEAMGHTVRFENRMFPLQAPHLVDLVMRNRGEDNTVIRTTVDPDLQHALDQILSSHENRLARHGISQAAAMIVTIPHREVVALVGSLGYRRRNLGYNNGVIARRSAGSTLKPFLYALALEQGSHAFSEIPDTLRSYPTPRGDYLPVNADRRSYGPVTVRSALGNSLNISAVKTARSLGVDNVYHLLRRLRVVDEDSMSHEHYGLGIAIGNVEVSLYSLVQAYAALADCGRFGNLKALRTHAEESGNTVISPEVAYIITHILSDPSARLLTFGNPGYFDFGFPVALKTGTSSNYRDCWLIAYTSKHVVGIWAGNFNGRPNNRVTGSKACGPILRDIIHHLYGTAGPVPFRSPERVEKVSVCSLFGRLAGPSCPHKTTDLAIKGSGGSVCDLPHIDTYRYLGGQYARWLHHREVRQGRGRFRLSGSGSAIPADVYGVPAADKPQRFMNLPGGTGAGLTPIRLRRGGTSRIEIVSPHDSDRFILSRHHRNRVLLRAIPRPVVGHVVWFVDGVEIARTPPPYEYFWKPTRGRHDIAAVTPNREAARVTIHVE